MCTPSGARSFDGNRQVQVATRAEIGPDVFAPVGFVEIDGQEKTRFVLEQRIDASDEGLAIGVRA